MGTSVPRGNTSLVKNSSSCKLGFWSLRGTPITQNKARQGRASLSIPLAPGFGFDKYLVMFLVWPEDRDRQHHAQMPHEPRSADD